MQKLLTLGLLSFSMAMLAIASMVYAQAGQSGNKDNAKEKNSVALTHMDVLKEFKKRRDSRAKRLQEKAAQMLDKPLEIAAVGGASFMSPLRSGYCECSCNAQNKQDDIQKELDDTLEKNSNEKIEAKPPAPKKKDAIWPLNQLDG